MKITSLEAPVGIEPNMFRLKGERTIHCPTGPCFRYHSFEGLRLSLPGDPGHLLPEIRLKGQAFYR